ncbi:putative transcriptional regulator SLK2 [Tasmannia lanceolata]|uniref:putative transcriptional regulator SLK2 n=1 Tax=Tasmannia lanceolata TaxID=3420 RepID=UPI0040640AEC
MVLICMIWSWSWSWSSRFGTAGRQLARSLDLQLLNDLGFSKRYVRCLQISEVVNSMKDLIDLSREHNIGPIESLKNYPRRAAAGKLQIPKMEQMVNADSLPADPNTLNKMMVMHPGLGSHMNSNSINSGTLNNTTQTSISLSNYQNLLRQNSNPDASCSFNGSNQAQSLPFQGPVSSVTGSLQNASVNGLTSPHQNSSINGLTALHQQQHLIKQSQQSSQANQHLQQHVIQQLLQEMMNSNGGLQQQPVDGQNANAKASEDVFGGATGMGYLAARTRAVMMNPSRNNSFKAAPTTSASSDGNGFNSRSDIPQNLHLGELARDFPQEFAENGMFNDEAGELGSGWKS